MSGKCPKCEKTITTIKALPIDAIDGVKKLKAAIYTCPLCQTILSAGPDPYRLADEIAHRMTLSLKNNRGSPN